MKNMRDKMFDYKHPVIFYELLPPEQHDTVNLDAYIECAVDLLTSTPIMIDAVNIPEIREEDHGVTERTQSYVPKMDPSVFAKMLEKASYNHIEVILNHCTVYESLKQQKLWLDSVSKQHQINLLILVGGNSSKSVYPGPSVVEMGKYIKNHYKNDILCGGITIPSRRYHDQVLDEPFRMYTKGLNGIDFFTTQVIYEPMSIKLLLRDYSNLCQEKGVQAKRIFLSFAPISTHKDLDFLRWLGVSIPKTVEQELFKANIGIGWRSTKVAVQIFQEILNFMNEERIQVPLGINIEHITRHNFELSLEFIDRLGGLYHHYMGYHQGSKPSSGPK